MPVRLRIPLRQHATVPRRGSGYEVVMTLLLAWVTLANEDGRTAGSTSGCGSCHGSVADEATVLTLYASDLTAAPGERLEAELVLTHPTQLGAGMNVSATGGALEAGAGSRLSGGELTHEAPLTLVDGTARFGFAWTLPDEAGTVRLRAAGNAVNGDGAATGDDWALASPLVVVVDAGCVDGDGDGVDACDGDCDDADAAVAGGCDTAFQVDSAPDTGGPAAEAGGGCGCAAVRGAGLAGGFLVLGLLAARLVSRRRPGSPGGP